MVGGGEFLVEETLYAGLVETEAGHDFVEDEERAVTRGDGANGGEVADVGHDEADVAAVGLENDAGDLARVGGERGVEGGGVVVGENDGLAGEGGGDAGAVGVAVGERAGTGFDEQRIGMAVVTAGEFNDLVALGEAACEADGRHRGFRAAAAHANFFDRGHEASNELGHLDLGGIGCAEGSPVFEGGGDGGFDDRVVVAVDRWAPGADEVDEFTVVGGDERGAARSLDEERRAADGAESADGGIDAARDELEGASEEGVGGESGHGLEIVSVLAVVNADNAHKDAFVEKACDRSVVAHAIAPAAMKSSGQGLIETPWICVAGDVRNEITRAAPVRLAVEALAFAQGLGLKLIDPARA